MGFTPPGKQQGRFLTKLEVVPWKLPFFIVWQLGGINEDVIIALTGLDDLPPHLVLGFLQGRGSSYVGNELLSVSQAGSVPQPQHPLKLTLQVQREDTHFSPSNIFWIWTE